VNRWLSQLLGVDGGPKVIGPRPQVIGPKPSLTVEAPPRFAWDEKRWRKRTSGHDVELVGQYRVFDQRRGRWREFRGRVVQQGGDIGAYINDPPTEMRQHRHGACLQLVEGRWFRLHFQRAPKNLDDAVLYLERMLSESLNGR
jgi:hypothetical protein